MRGRTAYNGEEFSGGELAAMNAETEAWREGFHAGVASAQESFSARIARIEAETGHQFDSIDDEEAF